MTGLLEIDGMESTFLAGPEDGARAAGGGEPACDPFYRAWLRTTRRALAVQPPEGHPAAVDVAAARCWIRSGDWGNTAGADLDFLAFDHDFLDRIGREVASALADGRPHAEAAALVRLLDRCARVHEAFESVLMELHADPDRGAHLDEHRSLQAQREQLLACHERGELAAARSVHAALQHWAHDHSRGPDEALRVLLGSLRRTRARPAPRPGRGRGASRGSVEEALGLSPDASAPAPS